MAALDPGPSVATLHHLRSLGVRISLDDFGTAGSTLSLLHDCPVDEIKLDRSFTQARSGGQVPMAAAVPHLAHALGLHAVAKGVETAEQAERLRAMGLPVRTRLFLRSPDVGRTDRRVALRREAARWAAVRRLCRFRR